MRASRRRNNAWRTQDWSASPREIAMTPGSEGHGPVDHAADDTSAMTVMIAIRPGNNSQEQTLAFRIPAGIDPAELRTANFALADGLATFTVAWVHEGDPDDGYFDAPFGESGQTLSGAVNIARRRLQMYLRAKGMTSSVTYHQMSQRSEAVMDPSHASELHPSATVLNDSGV
jgi:hypothetical protein